MSGIKWQYIVGGVLGAVGVYFFVRGQVLEGAFWVFLGAALGLSPAADRPQGKRSPAGRLRAAALGLAALCFVLQFVTDFGW